MSPILIALVVLAAAALVVAQVRLDKRDSARRASEAPRLQGPPGLSSVQGPASLSSPEGREFVDSIATASDSACALWPREEVQAAQEQLVRQYGAVPTLKALASRYGVGETERAIKEALEWRTTFLQALLKLNEITIRPGLCQLCGRPAAARYEFGLARIRGVESDWGATVLSVLLSATLGSLVGFGLIYGPKKTKTGNLLRLQLERCPDCDRERRGFLGFGRRSQRNCALHPWWAAAHAHGFTTFVSEAELSKWR